MVSLQMELGKQIFAVDIRLAQKSRYSINTIGYSASTG